MKTFLLGLVLGLAAVAVGAVVFIYSGGMPVPTKSKPLPFEDKIAEISIRAAMKGADALKPSTPVTDIEMQDAAKLYKENCALCHGLPGQSRPTAVAKGLFPQPPQLFEHDQGVTDDPLGTTYWVVKNGIRLTGMPGFELSLNDSQLWALTALLKTAGALPDSIRDILVH